jgi:hypothetical protein
MAVDEDAGTCAASAGGAGRRGGSILPHTTFIGSARSAPIPIRIDPVACSDGRTGALSSAQVERRLHTASAGARIPGTAEVRLEGTERR